MVRKFIEVRLRREEIERSNFPLEFVRDRLIEGGIEFKDAIVPVCSVELMLRCIAGRWTAHQDLEKEELVVRQFRDCQTRQ
jgi:hypothetical protein